MKILSITLIVVLLSALLLGSCVLYDIHHEVDRTPIVEIPFDPSKKDVIRLENFKIPRSGRFDMLFYISSKDRKDIYKSGDFTITDYIRHNMFTVNYQVNVNGKEHFKVTRKPHSFKGDIKNEIYQMFHSEKYRKNDVLDVVIKNQYTTDKFRDFDVVFKIHEVKPESK